jgi:hypothetical protein
MKRMIPVRFPGILSHHCQHSPEREVAEVGVRAAAVHRQSAVGSRQFGFLIDHFVATEVGEIVIQIFGTETATDSGSTDTCPPRPRI